MSIRISNHAKARLRDRHVPPYELRSIIAKAEQHGDGNYPTATAQIIVRGDTITTVLTKDMVDTSGLPIYN